MISVLHLTSKPESEQDMIAMVVQSSGDIYIRHTDKFTYLDDNFLAKIDLVIKDRYSEEIPEKFLSGTLPIIAFIPALLPHNRGVHSVLWSILENTPVGGTIFQFFSSNYNVGIMQRIACSPDYESDTLRTLYNKIFDGIYNSFKENYPEWRLGIKKTEQLSDYEGYPIRTIVDSEKILKNYPLGIDTPLSHIRRS